MAQKEIIQNRALTWGHTLVYLKTNQKNAFIRNMTKKQADEQETNEFDLICIEIPEWQRRVQMSKTSTSYVGVRVNPPVGCVCLSSSAPLKSLQSDWCTSTTTNQHVLNEDRWIPTNSWVRQKIQSEICYCRWRRGYLHLSTSSVHVLYSNYTSFMDLRCFCTQTNNLWLCVLEGEI